MPKESKLQDLKDFLVMKEHYGLFVTAYLYYRKLLVKLLRKDVEFYWRKNQQ